MNFSQLQINGESSAKLADADRWGMQNGIFAKSVGRNNHGRSLTRPLRMHEHLTCLQRKSAGHELQIKHQWKT